MSRASEHKRSLGDLVRCWAQQSACFQMREKHATWDAQLLSAECQQYAAADVAVMVDLLALPRSPPEQQLQCCLGSVFS